MCLTIYTDYQNPDTDGDGLLDGEEIDVNIRTDTFKDNIRYFFLYSSYPDKADSDGDGLLDSELVANEWGWEIRDPEPIYANEFTAFGSIEYFKEHFDCDKDYFDYKYLKSQIQKRNEDEINGYITKIMNQVNSAEYYDLIPYENWSNFCEIFNVCVVKKGSVDVNLHYFRNKLNRAPSTLEELITLSNDKVSKEWTMCGVFSSRYHMNGLDGEYNLKFVSDCGKYEAVYNLDGELLTEQNDPVNMGTYNYAGYLIDVVKHSNLDVSPYNSYGYTINTDSDINLNFLNRLEIYYAMKF